MNLETGKVSVPLWVMWVVVLVAVTIAFWVWYLNIDDEDTKLVGLVGGIVSGLVLYIGTFVTLLKPLQDLDRFNRMGIRNLLANRHDKAYYHRLLVGAENEVMVMGASCTRFVDDFLDASADDKVLVDALRANKGLTVQLLIPAAQYLSPEAGRRSSGMEKKLGNLRSEFGNRVELRRFEFPAQHSFVICDDDMVAGPIFDGDASRHAPAVHVSTSTAFAKKYREHFELVWQVSERS